MRNRMCFGLLGMVLLGFVALARPGSQALAANSSPVNLTFDKSAVASGVWNGTVGGDIQGNLATTLTGLDVSGAIWHVDFIWDIDDTDLSDGDQSFVANLSGILNTKTGGVVMNGKVTEGYLLGAQVHEEGQLINPATLHFQGSIQVMPATAE